MSVYSDLIDSLNPVRYARCDELLAGVLTDSSAFAKHGTTESGATFGHPSAIETDPASSSIGGPVGRFPAAASGEADLKGNFTWMFWQFYDVANPSGVALCRRGQLGLANSVQAGINEDNIFADVTLDNGGSGDFFPLASPLTLVDQTWYFVTVVRNGTTLLLYVNADIDLGNSRSDLTGADVDYNVDGTDWFLGRSVNTAVFTPSRLDEVVFLDYALAEATVAEVYEAALNSLSLFGVSNVISSAILYSDIEPDPISFPFRHNWSDPLIERISFATGVSRAVKGYEQANAQRVKPRREIEISQMLRDDHERRVFHAKLNAHQHRKWFIPILEDRERLVTSLSAGAVSIMTDTQYRDYEVGGYVGVRELNSIGRITKSEEALIATLTNNQIDTTLVNSYTNPEVYPARRAVISHSQSLRGHTDSVEDTTILARLIAEDEKVSPRRLVEWTPATTYESHEVFPVAEWPNDWSELRDYSVDRDVREVDYELGSFAVESDAVGANETFSWRILLQTKQQQAEFLGWFYARAGSLAYLWVPSMQRDFTIVSAISDDLTVEGHNYFDNFAGSQFRRDLAFVYHDNTMAFARIEGVSLSGVNEVLALSSMPTTTNLRSVSYFRFCRLENDTLEIARVTDTKARFAWRFQEILSSPA